MGKPYNDLEVMKRLYIEKDMKQAEIADKFDVHPSTISRKISKFNLTKPYKNPKVLHELHHEKRLTLNEMADQFGIAPSTVYYHMEENDVEIRDRAEAAILSGRKTAPPLQVDSDGYERFVDSLQENTKVLGHHRLLAVVKYGFDEVGGKEVHHKNGVPWDNRPENLKPMTDSEHRAHHNEQRGN